MLGDLGCSVGLPCPTAGFGVPQRARDLPPAPAQAPGCAGAAGTRRPQAQGDLRGCFGRFSFTFCRVDGQGFTQRGLGLR